MGDQTGIQWTNATWNPTTGCSRVSPGCTNCYMFRDWPRLQRMRVKGYEGDPGVIHLHPERLLQPVKWKRPRRIFVCSMSDLFHPAVPWDFILSIFGVMASCPQHTFQLLTKRPGRMAHFADTVLPEYQNCHPMGPWDWPPNVWAGTSVESSKYLPRLKVLSRVPAKVRFVSCEPLLGPLKLTPYLPCAECGGTGGFDANGAEGYYITEAACPTCFLAGPDKGSVNWVIAGGESGGEARPPIPPGSARFGTSARKQMSPSSSKVGGVGPIQWGYR